MVSFMPKQEKGAFYVPEEQLIAMVEGLRRGEREADKLMRRLYRGYVSRYLAIKVPYREIPTLMENTFTNAILYIDKLEKPAAFTSWIRTIVHSEIYHYHKEEEQKKKQAEKDAKRAKEKRLREERFMAGLDLSVLDVREAVNTLPAKQKEAVLLREKGYKVREIAEIQKVSDGTVKSRLNYARKKVNTYLDEQAEKATSQNEASD